VHDVDDFFEAPSPSHLDAVLLQLHPDRLQRRSWRRPHTKPEREFTVRLRRRRGRTRPAIRQRFSEWEHDQRQRGREPQRSGEQLADRLDEQRQRRDARASAGQYSGGWFRERPCTDAIAGRFGHAEASVEQQRSER
jgi:hypothetical protein